jgi:hypothetical protein
MKFFGSLGKKKKLKNSVLGKLLLVDRQTEKFVDDMVVSHVHVRTSSNLSPQLHPLILTPSTYEVDHVESSHFEASLHRMSAHISSLSL